MADFLLIFPYLRIILFGLIVIIASIYSLPIIILKRFHYRNNFITLNICVATIFSALYWFLFYLMFQLDTMETFRFMLRNCRFVSIVPVILTLQVPLSFVTGSINRFWAIVYHQNRWHKSKHSLIACIFTQWTVGTLLTLPILAGINPVRLVAFLFHSIKDFLCYRFVPELSG